MQRRCIAVPVTFRPGPSDPRASVDPVNAEVTSPNRHRTPLLVTMCVGYFLVLLDVTVVNVALPQMGARLGIGGGELSWVVTGYSVPFAALLLAAGTTGDRLGHRRVVLAGLAVFGLGSLGCALSPGLGALVAARAVQGIGAALLLPGTLAEISRAFPEPAERTRAIGAWASIGGMALPAGPLVGGLLLEFASWRAVFWINVPIVLVAVAVAARVLPREAGDPTRRADLPGTALGVAFLAALVFAAAEKNWPAGVVSVALLVGFVHVERRSPQPVLPVRLFADRAFTRPNLGAVVMNGTCQGMLFVLALLLQDVQGRTALQAGLAALPVFLPLALLPLLSGRLITRFGPARVAGMAFLTMTPGLVLLGLVGRTTPYLAMAPALLLWGVGLGLLTPAIVTAAVSAVPAERSGLASAVNNTARQAGGSAGIAALAALAGPATAPGFVAGFRTAAMLAALACAAMTVPMLLAARPGAR
jgi:MFS transporter, DHA2 family, methylenomycin A resistance protein